MSTLNPVWIVAFSGHRPSNAPGAGPGRSKQALRDCRPAIHAALQGLKTQAEQQGGRIELLSSAAAGADVQAIACADELGIGVHVVLPKPTEMFEQDFTDGHRDDWEMSKSAINRSEAPGTPGSLIVVDGPYDSDDCYHDANFLMLRSADALVAVWNGVESTSLGGTAQMIELAAHLDLPSIVIDPVNPDQTNKNGDWSKWTETDPVLSQLNEIIESEPEPAPPQQGERGGEGPAWDIYARLDSASNKLNSQFNSRLWYSLWLHFIAAGMAACNAALAKPFKYIIEQSDYSESTPSIILHNASSVVTGIELVLVTIAWYLMHKADNDNLRDRWRISRFGAEVADGIINTCQILNPLRPAVAAQNPRWRRYAVSLGIFARNNTPPADIESLSRTYQTKRIDYQRDRYFKKQQAQSDKLKHRLHKTESLTTIAAPPIILIALILKIILHDDVSKSIPLSFIAMLLPILLPLTAGAAISMLVAKDAGRRAGRYSDMARRLGRFSKLNETAKTKKSLEQVVGEAEELFLDELSEWDIAAAQAGG
ncbi:MAG: hypothetical protein ACE37H_12070 [Phycisphaeraceae bacterium]